MPLVNVNVNESLEDIFSDRATYDYGFCTALNSNFPHLVEALKESPFSLVLDLDVDLSATSLMNKEINWFDFYSTIESSYPNSRVRFGYEGDSIFTSLSSEDAYRTYVLFPTSLTRSQDTGEVKALLSLFAVTHKGELDTEVLQSVIQAALVAYHKEFETA